MAIGAWPNGRGGDCKEYSESTIGYGPGVRVEIEEITRVSGQAHRAPLYSGQQTRVEADRRKERRGVGMILNTHAPMHTDIH